MVFKVCFSGSKVTQTQIDVLSQTRDINAECVYYCLRGWFHNTYGKDNHLKFVSTSIKFMCLIILCIFMMSTSHSPIPPYKSASSIFLIHAHIHLTVSICACTPTFSSTV